ncbi:hypothetical protein [Streptomyces sp. S465]|uniref:hypothetical protein n=1 Tax=Streptomyces sp. S465 TaxID=2979468 RepID=UPI0022A887EE|nr:hypothetical protein [Streptomyces sp. S465]WAP55027.1 hypothetical protein N6H00_08505 [Streptomyces sp. S465]
MVAKVCLAEAGAVFGLEVSRLARSNADIARLLELAGLTDTLVVDLDGVYDLADMNDRLLRPQGQYVRGRAPPAHRSAFAQSTLG